MLCSCLSVPTALPRCILHSLPTQHCVKNQTKQNKTKKNLSRLNNFDSIGTWSVALILFTRLFHASKRSGWTSVSSEGALRRCMYHHSQEKQCKLTSVCFIKMLCCYFSLFSLLWVEKTKKPWREGSLLRRSSHKIEEISFSTAVQISAKNVGNMEKYSNRWCLGSEKDIKWEKRAVGEASMIKIHCVCVWKCHDENLTVKKMKEKRWSFQVKNQSLFLPLLLSAHSLIYLNFMEQGALIASLLRKVFVEKIGGPQCFCARKTLEG